MFKGWRTIALNVLGAAIPILSMTELMDVLPEEWLPWYALALALANMFMRSITTTPMGKK
jgi:hypothetical protein